jgi:hypothetical protein
VRNQVKLGRRSKAHIKKPTSEYLKPMFTLFEFRPENIIPLVNVGGLRPSRPPQLVGLEASNYGYVFWMVCQKYGYIYIYIFRNIYLGYTYIYTSIYIHILDMTSRIHVHIWKPPGRLIGGVWRGVALPTMKSKEN